MNQSKTAKPLIPALTHESGRYAQATSTGVFWRYGYQIDAAGSKSESRSGLLYLENAELPAARVGDRLRTPWGTMQLADTPFDRGWLLELSGGRPIDWSVGRLLEMPSMALSRGGAWKGAAGEWSYSVRAFAMGSKSERRMGEVRHRGLVILGGKQGDFLKTPWGPVYWMGPTALDNTTDYEQGFLLQGTFDRPLDALHGNLIEIDHCAVEHRLESLYLDAPVRLEVDGPGGRGIGLRFVRRPAASSMLGTLTIDPNMCSLNAFGDREGCSKIATRSIDVTITLQRLGDPAGLRRGFYEVRGEGLSQGVALIMSPAMERCVLKLDKALVPLFLEADG